MQTHDPSHLENVPCTYLYTRRMGVANDHFEISTALGGSTNAVLHILAIAREANVPLTIHEFGDIGEKVPLLGNLSPHGPFHMADLDTLGGVQAVMKELLEAGFIHGDCLTVTGKTVAEVTRPESWVRVRVTFGIVSYPVCTFVLD